MKEAPTTETITTRIWAKADLELKKTIHNGIWGLYEKFDTEFGGNWPRPDKVSNGEGITLEKVWVPGLMRSTQEAIFLSLRDKNRLRAVEAFLAKVTNMSDELDQLKAEVQQ